MSADAQLTWLIRLDIEKLRRDRTFHHDLEP
jgi:hypothetical protein